MLTKKQRKTWLLSLGTTLMIAFTLTVAGITMAEDAPDYLARGDRHFEEKSYRKAYKAYEQLLKEDPDFKQTFRVKLRMGHCQVQLGNHDKAETQLVELADSEGLSNLERGRASYRLGHYYMTRPHAYYENSKGEKSWGKWIPDAKYHRTGDTDIKNAKDRLGASWKLLAPLGREGVKTISTSSGETASSKVTADIEMAQEAYNAGLDAAAALHAWQKRLDKKRKSIDYFDSDGQKQTYSYSVYEFPDRDEILKRHDDLVEFSESLKKACRDLKSVRRKKTPKGLLEACESGIKKGDAMASLALYRKGSFLVAMTQIDDWQMNRLLYHPDLEDFNPLEGIGGHPVDDPANVANATSPIPVLKRVYKDYHHTPYADDAQYFIGYCYQQVGQHDLADKAYEALVNDETFKDSTETSSARYNLQYLRSERISVKTVVSDAAIASDKKVRKWANGAVWYFRDNVGTDRSLFKKDEHLGLWVESRNVDNYTVRALTFDAPGLIKDRAFLDAKTNGLGHIGDSAIASVIDKYAGEEVFRQSYATGDNGRHLYTRMKFELPQALPNGAYLIEVDTGAVKNRRLVVISDAQLVIQTYNADENLAIFVDSDTGAPVSNTTFVYKRWNSWWSNGTQHWRTDVSKYASDEQGRVRIPTVGNGDYDGYLLFAESGGRYAWVQDGFPWWQRRGYNSHSTYDTRMYSMTDRPVYRPGDGVHGKIILRQRDGGEWKNVNGAKFRLELRDPKGNEKINKLVTATEFGALEYDLTLENDAALGAWYFYVRSADGNWIGSGGFQVEEYKKPEFEVAVSPPDKPVKLGQAIAATIKGEYYFGSPSSGADVSYKVYRNFYFHSVYFPRRYDWLYNWQTPTYYGTPDQQFYRNSNRELVTEGTGKLDENGEMVIEWGTDKALKDWGEYDHQYTVKAEVTDSSRRTIEGSGSVKALRRAFFAFVDNKLGFYRPSDKLDVEVRTVTADDNPVQTQGKLDIYEVTFVKGVDEEGMTQIDELKTLVSSHDLNTDERGLAFFKNEVTQSGTFELVYRTKDEWGSEITGQTRVIVKADVWSPGSFRFGTISLLPQQKVYTEGETASVLLATDIKDAWMLISVMGGNEVITQTFADLEQTGGQIELELTVGREHLPNFHINVLTIQRGELYTQTVELFVPPVDQFLDVEVKTDKEWYKPGEKGTVTVSAKDNEGKPVQAEFALTVFDRSITYIMQDRIPNIIKHFYSDRRSYRLNYENSYTTSVNDAQWDNQKYEDYSWYGAPLGYGVDNWLSWEKNHFDFDEERKDKADRFARGFSSTKETSDYETDGENSDDELRDKDSAMGGGRGQGGSGGFAYRKARGGVPAPENAKRPLKDADEPGQSDGDWGEEGEVQKLEKSLEEVATESGAATPHVRSNFKDSALYAHNVTTGMDGTATVEIEFPDNLTDWRIAARGITKVAKVGEAFSNVKTKKNLILRDQAPRFFVEGDVVTLSGIIMNRYETDLDVEARLMLNTGAAENYASFELFPETPDIQKVTVPANGEVRVDWQVRMTGAGKVAIQMLALSKLESDATLKEYDCKVRGAEMYQATTAVIQDDQQSQSFEVDLPEKLDPEQTNLDLQLSPSVAALAMDALPYLLQFPYGCTEQTMSRFLPAVLVRKTLRDAGISLEEVGRRRAQLEYDGVNPQAAYWYKRNPVFDTATMNAIIDAGLKRLTAFQHGDGGWGWWQGGRSDTYMSAYVVYGLATAKDAGIQIDDDMLNRGVSFLKSRARKEKTVHRAAYAAFVLSYAGNPDKELLDEVYERRDDLTHQSRAMVCMAEWLAGDKERARILISNIEDYRKEDLENGTVWWESGREYWWWWNDKVETNAFVMRAFVMVDPDNQYLEKHVRWLAQNRKGTRWNSTKDTSHAVSALMSYARASGELDREYTVTVKMDGDAIHKWDVTKGNIFALQTNLRLKGVQLPPGKHTFTIEREGEGKVYFSSFLSYFSKEDKLKPSGNELHIDRKYYKLVEKVENVEVTKTNDDGTTSTHMEKRLTYERVPLEFGANVTSGDKIEVELNFSADNDYEYLAFEDYKPAGCEPVALRSGRGYGGGLCQNVELRDDRVAFFVSYMPQGSARLKYQLRCEIPGTFSALPTQGGSMYVSEVRANSEEWKVTIKDKS